MVIGRETIEGKSYDVFELDSQKFRKDHFLRIARQGQRRRDDVSVDSFVIGRETSIDHVNRRSAQQSVRIVAEQLADRFGKSQLIASSRNRAVQIQFAIVILNDEKHIAQRRFVIRPFRNEIGLCGRFLSDEIRDRLRWHAVHWIRKKSESFRQLVQIDDFDQEITGGLNERKPAFVRPTFVQGNERFSVVRHCPLLERK